MPDLTPAEARQFLAELTALSKRMGIALGSYDDGGSRNGQMELFKADPTGSYTFTEGNFLDGSVVFDGIEWTEPKG
jgi:hypothetical protein